MRKFLLFFALVFLVSCSTVTNLDHVKLNIKDKKITVLPFENYTETPLAGLRVKSITEGVVSSKGHKLSIANVRQDKDYSPEEIKKLLQELKESNIDYAITGSVNEFRYKTGIDGEPAVSITVKIYDIKQEKEVYTSVSSKTGWSHESITTVAQKILNKIIP
jgi:TolB-like protein